MPSTPYHDSSFNSYDFDRRGPSRPAGSHPSEAYGQLQDLVDEMFSLSGGAPVSRMDLIMRAELEDLDEDLREVIDLLPSGSYERGRLCDQMNSIITAHGWGYVYGTVE